MPATESAEQDDLRSQIDAVQAKLVRLAAAVPQICSTY